LEQDLPEEAKVEEAEEEDEWEPPKKARQSSKDISKKLK